MATYVLVPGACHGGWWYEPLAARLEAAGHRALPVTPTGLDPQGPVPGSTVNLDTHIEDVVRVFEENEVEHAVLVGHSYGGMVISGAADRLPDGAVDALVHLDAFVPRDGESCWTLVDEEMRRWYTSVDATGYRVPPLPSFDERAVPHPLACLLQRIRLGGDPAARVRRRDYVFAADWGGARSPFQATLDRLRRDPSWNVHVLDARHNLLRDAPDAVERILLGAAAPPEGRARARVSPPVRV